MTETILDFDSLIVLSEMRTPIVCPSDLTISRRDFYDRIQRIMEEYELPVQCADCCVRFEEESDPKLCLVTELLDHRVPYLRSLLGLEKFGGLAYAERRLLLTPPELPPLIASDSSELPPRLTPASAEWSPLGYDRRFDRAAHRLERFKTGDHKTRFLEMERRRQERRALIENRKKERQTIIEGWLEEVSQVIAQFKSNPRVAYFKDSVDIVLGAAIEELEASGARSRRDRESVTEQEELNQRLEELRKRF